MEKLYFKIIGEINKELVQALDIFIYENAAKLEEEGMELCLCINSPGGNVFEGIKLVNMLSVLSCKIHAKIEGIAASMAADLAMCADSVSMCNYSLLMFHDAYSDNEDLDDSMKMYLEKQSLVLQDMVIAKRKLSDGEAFRKMCKKEYWYTPKEALEKGLIDSIEDENFVNMEEEEYESIYKMKNIEEIFKFYSPSENKNIDINMELEKEIVLEAVVKEEVSENVSNNAELEAVLAENNSLRVTIESLEKEINAFKEANVNTEIKRVLEDATKLRKITDTTSPIYEKLLRTDFEATKSLIEAIEVNKVVVEAPKVSTKSYKEVIDITKEVKPTMNIVEMSKNNPKELENIFKNNKALYCSMYKAYYGVEYN